jgi:5-epi-alpha-selinene synthase
MSIIYPFPSQVNPLVNTVDPVILTWAKQKGLLPSAQIEVAFDQSKINWFGAYIYPNADREWLTLVSKLFCILFLIDDIMDSMNHKEALKWAKNFESKTSSFLKRRDEHEKNTSFILAFYDFARSLEDKCGSDVLNSFSEVWSEFCHAMIWESSNKAKGIIPDINEYNSHRLYFSGVYIAIFFLKHMLSNKDLPTFYMLEAKNLSFHAANLICLANDLCSYPKELNSGDFHNHVIIAMKIFNFTESQAVEWVKKIHDKHMKDFFVDFPAIKANPLLTQFFQGLKEIVVGSNAWSNMETDRYLAGSNGSIII